MPSKRARYSGLDMDAPVTVCSRNTNVIIMVWAWMPCTLCSRSTNVIIMVWAWMPCTLCSRKTKLLCLGQGCSGQCISPETRTLFWFGQGCSGQRISRETRTIFWFGMLWSPYALETRSLFQFGHGRSGQHFLAKHERYDGLGMDALVGVCSRNANVIMVCVCGRARVLENPRQNNCCCCGAEGVRNSGKDIFGRHAEPSYRGKFWQQQIGSRRYPPRQYLLISQARDILTHPTTQAASPS